MFRKLLPCLALAALSLPATAAPVTYMLDADHTHPAFEFPHMGISIWRGIFAKTSGSVVLGRGDKAGSVDVKVETASIEFAHTKMNEHAKGDGWFNTAQFPDATYKGAIKFTGDAPSSIDGQLTLMGVTKPLTLKIVSFKCID